MKLGMERGLGPGQIVFEGDPAPLPQRGTAIFGPCLLWGYSRMAGHAGSLIYIAHTDMTLT